MDRPARTVLIVDKSTTMRYYHGMLLTRLGCAVLSAASPEEALMIMEHTIPSCVITERLFPMMSSIDFIKKLKGTDRTRFLPLIVLTDEKDVEGRKTLLDLGCASYLTKPVEPDNLYRAVQAATEATPRSNIRLGTNLKAFVGDTEGAGHATVISEEGLFLKTPSPQPKDAVTPIKIFVNDREIKATAMVVYSHSLERGFAMDPGMALRFVTISEDDRNFLRKFIQEQLTSDILPKDPA